MLNIIKEWSVKRKCGKLTRVMCIAECDCGEKFQCMKENIKRGNTTKCNECANKSRSKLHTTHGMSKLNKELGGKLYYTWRTMKARCQNPNAQRYVNYGGRGISVSDEWSDNFDLFSSDMGEPPTTDHSIERIDNNGNYCKSNCKWATKDEQANNKSNNRIISLGSKSLTLQQWAKLTGIKRGTIARRLNSGWDAATALSRTPPSVSTPNGRFTSLSQAAKSHSMSISGIHGRIQSDNYPDWFKLRK